MFPFERLIILDNNSTSSPTEEWIVSKILFYIQLNVHIQGLMSWSQALTQSSPTKWSRCTSGHCLIPDDLLRPKIAVEDSGVARPPFVHWWSLVVSIRCSDWQDESKADVLGEALNGDESRPGQLILNFTEKKISNLKSKTSLFLWWISCIEDRAQWCNANSCRDLGKIGLMPLLSEVFVFASGRWESETCLSPTDWQSGKA